MSLNQTTTSHNEAIKLDKKLRKKAVLHRNIVGTLMAISPFVGFLCFTMLPMAFSLVISFTELHSYDLSLAKYNGIQNYIRLFDGYNGEYTLKAFSNTLSYMLSVPINLVLIVFLSNVMNKKIVLKKVWLIILFLPQVCSSVASTIMWQWIFEENYGIINTVIYKLGGAKIHFMSDERAFMPAIYIMSAWQRGTNVIVLLAAFASVDKNIQEAARIDGASELRVFWSVTWAQLTPTIFYLLTMNLITALQEQAVFQLITTNGVGPNFRAVTLVYYIYRMAFTNAEFKPLPKESLVDCVLPVINNETDKNVLTSKYAITSGNNTMVYGGVPNQKGNIIISLPKQGTYVVNGETVNITGDYTIKISASGYHDAELYFSLNDTIQSVSLEGKTQTVKDDKKFTKKLGIKQNEYGTVSVNGKSVSSSATLKYDETTQNYYNNSGQVFNYYRKLVGSTQDFTAKVKFSDQVGNKDLDPIETK